MINLFDDIAEELEARGALELASLIDATIDHLKNAGTYFEALDEELEDLGFDNVMKRSDEAAEFLDKNLKPSMQEALPLNRESH